MTRLPGTKDFFVSALKVRSVEVYLFQINLFSQGVKTLTHKDVCLVPKVLPLKSHCLSLSSRENCRMKGGK